MARGHKIYIQIRHWPKQQCENTAIITVLSQYYTECAKHTFAWNASLVSCMTATIFSLLSRWVSSRDILSRAAHSSLWHSTKSFSKVAYSCSICSRSSITCCSLYTMAINSVSHDQSHDQVTWLVNPHLVTVFRLCCKWLLPLNKLRVEVLVFLCDGDQIVETNLLWPAQDNNGVVFTKTGY